MNSSETLHTMTHSQKFPQDDTLSPKLDSISRALHSLRLKIQEEKLKRTTLSPESGVRHPQRLTRKICRATSKEAKTALASGGIGRLSVKKHAGSSVSHEVCHQRSALWAEQSTYISAWKNVQGLVKQILNSENNIKDQRECLNKSSPQQCNVLNARQNRGQCSNEPRKEENSAEKPSSPMKAQDLSQQISRSPSGEVFSSRALQMKNRYHFFSPTSKVFTESHHRDITKTARSPASEGKENDDQAKSNRKPRRDVQEVHEYMRRQAVERRRRVLNMKKEAEQKNERKLRNVQEVFKKQREALQRAKNLQYECRGSFENDVSDTAEKQMTGPNQSVLVAEQVDQGESGSPVSAADADGTQNNLAAQRLRVEALRKTIAALDTRLDEETVWLGITGHRGAQRQTQPTGQRVCGAESRETLSDCVSLNRDTETDLSHKEMSVPKEIRDEVGDEEGMCATDRRLCSAERESKQQTDQIDQTAIEQVMKSEDSESTDPSSKWSELSELYGQQIHSRLSLAQIQQFLREEELRARQYSAIFRLREKALWEKTQAELQCLKHYICHKAHDDELVLAELKHKQETVVRRFQQEQAEIHHWRNIYRSGRQQRRLLLHHQRDILDIKQSTTHFKQVLQEQTVPKTLLNSRPENTATEEDVIMQPGIMPDARGAYKASREEGSLLSKAGLRRLLKSDEVWSLARKRNQVELVPAEHDILQITESNNPPSSPSHRYGRQSQTSLRLISPERKAKTDGDSGPCQRDSVKTLTARPDVNEQDTQKKVPGFYEDTRTSKTIESCKERFQHPDEGPLKPVLNIQRFTLNHEPNPHSDKVPTQSSLSSGTQEDLQLHSKDSHLKPKDQENIKKRAELHISTTAETKALNVKNNQRSQSVVLMNNNHDICEKIPSVEHSKSEQEQNTQASTNEALIKNLIMKRTTEDGPSCEDGPCKTDEKSWSIVFAEKYIVVPEASRFKLDFNNSSERYEGRTTAESLLSEILSPVDEVLSYGSAELPPSVKARAETGLSSYSCPPPPAFEIITWTSEDELQLPPDFLEDLSVNSENLPPLPVDVSLRRSLGSGSLKEKDANSDDANRDLCKTLPPSMCVDDENDCSEYTSSLAEDARNELSDPLCSFQFGERVLVCNSRFGVLKYKGLTAFADGFWAGVALDTPTGNHNGTFKGVTYFSCDKSHGVLVRAEDISHVHTEHGSDVETGVDEDPFSDEEPPSTQRDKTQKNELSSAGEQEERMNSQCPPRHREKDVSYPSELSSPKDVRKPEDSYLTPHLLEQWHQAQPDTPKIKVPPHEDAVVYRLVDAAVEILCGQANDDVLDCYETPNYLIDGKSCKAYRQVMFQLTSDVLHDILGDLLRTKQSCQSIDNESVISALQSSNNSVTFLKAAVRKEIQKALNLERNEQHMTAMLQKLCKYWCAKRDRVDYILIQELHNEERTWQDYTADQYTVKMRLTEEIFSLLLDDTILTLNHVHLSA